MVSIFMFNMRKLKRAYPLRICPAGSSFYVQLGWFVQILGYVFPVLFPLADAFGEQVFDLSVYGAEIVFCPSCYGIVQFFRQSQRHLLFTVFRHISTGCRCLRSAAHRDCHRARRGGWRPSQLFFPRQVLRSRSHSNVPGPSPPCRRRRPRSSFWRR